ncbi:MAG: hypothetical protein PHZ07_00720 [Patescibacteria group bacterium]|nr:hypothetical protein [Patescibacteria group bacterium]MDD4304792.1 hypothetical protein [Patescibacteria group bacterium]MDD4695277.1 hypothetical protein [Patescibacteria group bacterium]
MGTQEDYFGKKVDEIIDILVGFVFEKLPGIIIIAVIIFLLWKIFQPSINITY